MANFTALYDANVLYPAVLRDLLMRLALTDLYRAKWSDDIHDEWIRSLLDRRPDRNRERLERTRHLMNVHVRDCLVTGYEELAASLTLPDPDDLLDPAHPAFDRIQHETSRFVVDGRPVDADGDEAAR